MRTSTLVKNPVEKRGCTDFAIKKTFMPKPECSENILPKENVAQDNNRRGHMLTLAFLFPICSRTCVFSLPSPTLIGRSTSLH